MSISVFSASRSGFAAMALVLALPLSLGAASAAAEALESQFSYLIVETDAEGAEQLVARTSVKPGETIHYQLQHTNTTEDAMSGLVIAAPVPQGVTISLGSETTSVPAVFEVQAELDPENEGLEWSTLPATRVVIEADGTTREEPLPEADIAAVRWSYSEPLDPGAVGLNAYRVRVN
ncbi:hypothetical protein CBW24_17580 (plasmid) [Pacificitalea manganoxidans]|jgi:uncharacterized repeat protein (TIGR01451 family)|uniref:Repeat protein (TIGR01451 family) n=1 Tax=Pacificitalea manganoxidans TaxID=1411902 RepID=A0A291M4P1_9RHOB|nr:hypothetical protein [Pacificitalea manganoxidans]ATI43953.1 hypothetical protein CBW24_17580 [Pacificitalea manganoxidans]MBF51768.1 hypothetical protein [Actibacterium sp.]MDR6310332.1 putative repeat protein (TIGR01451 family) [Pacificitalea manganoxidans]OWU66692.1 hypothetical protein ATO2_17725 [Roseovarius sp. 22II1-1F6A]|tara:strand:- start:37 stop:567 length:531 start_codon:yes stop_codon:yes gene_type:complete